jgi:hypothetical protein
MARIPVKRMVSLVFCGNPTSDRRFQIGVGIPSVLRQDATFFPPRIKESSAFLRKV